MIEQLILFAIIVALLGYHYFFAKQAKEERKELMNAIIAKNSTELRDLKMADNIKVEVKNPEPPTEEPLENMSTEEHFKLVMKQAEDRALTEE